MIKKYSYALTASLLVCSFTSGKDKTIQVRNNKQYSVKLIIQSYFNQNDTFYYAWPLCNQVWNDYGAQQNSYLKGTYQPIKNVCFQSTIPTGNITTYVPVDIPSSLNQGFTLYIWDPHDGKFGRLFVRMNVRFGSLLEYPNDFSPR